MKKNNMYKLDKFFIGVMIVLGIIGPISDTIYWRGVTQGGFPVFSLGTIFIEYAIWIIISIYSLINYEKSERPYFAKWYMYFIIPFYHIAIMLIVVILGGLVFQIINA